MPKQPVGVPVGPKTHQLQARSGRSGSSPTAACLSPRFPPLSASSPDISRNVENDPDRPDRASPLWATTPTGTPTAPNPDPDRAG